MARVRTRMANVFIGHPFKKRFPTQKFRQIFKQLPFNIIYGNTNLQTKHLLSIMKANILKSDFCIFDLSDWNPNVSLELGIAEGLRKKSGRDYYILLNTRRSNEVPSDIRGLQRLEYTSYDFKTATGLGYQLIQYILPKEYWVRQTWNKISSGKNTDKKRLLTLRLLAHLRDFNILTTDNLKTIVRGTRLRQQDVQEVIGILEKFKIIQKIRNTKSFRKKRNIFKF